MLVTSCKASQLVILVRKSFLLGRFYGARGATNFPSLAPFGRTSLLVVGPIGPLAALALGLLAFLAFVLSLAAATSTCLAAPNELASLQLRGGVQRAFLDGPVWQNVNPCPRHTKCTKVCSADLVPCAPLVNEGAQVSENDLQLVAPIEQGHQRTFISSWSQQEICLDTGLEEVIELFTMAGTYRILVQDPGTHGRCSLRPDGSVCLGSRALQVRRQPLMHWHCLSLKADSHWRENSLHSGAEPVWYPTAVRQVGKCFRQPWLPWSPNSEITVIAISRENVCNLLK